jgi:hypothetical protein
MDTHTRGDTVSPDFALPPAATQAPGMEAQPAPSPPPPSSHGHGLGMTGPPPVPAFAFTPAAPPSHHLHPSTQGRFTTPVAFPGLSLLGGATSTPTPLAPVLPLTPAAAVGRATLSPVVPRAGIVALGAVASGGGAAPGPPTTAASTTTKRLQVSLRPRDALTVDDAMALLTHGTALAVKSPAVTSTILAAVAGTGAGGGPSPPASAALSGRVATTHTPMPPPPKEPVKRSSSAPSEPSSAAGMFSSRCPTCPAQLCHWCLPVT